MSSATTKSMVLAAAALMFSTAGAGDDINVSDFEAWSERSFSDHTKYTITVDDDATPILEAVTRGNASAFYRRGRIDLDATPCLSWRWRIDGTAPRSLDELGKAGDDYAARVYVVRRGGLAFWRAETINYVWSASQAVGRRCGLLTAVTVMLVPGSGTAAIFSKIGSDHLAKPLTILMVSLS